MNHLKCRTAGIAALIVLLAAVGPASAQTNVEFIGNQFIHSLANDGTAAAGVTADNAWEVFRWNREDGVERLGQNALLLVGRSAGTVGISADGTRVGATIATLDSTLVTQGLWTEGQGWQETMPPVPADGGEVDDALGSGWGISGDGTTVFGLYWRPGQSDGIAHANTWTEQDGLIGLGGQGNSSRANGANYDGSVVVGYAKHPDWGGGQPTVWEDGEMTVLVEWDRGGQLRATNQDGTILVGYVYDAETNMSPATLWFKTDTGWDEVPLGVLPGSFPNWGTGIALGMSDDASIVVGNNRFSMDDYGGFVWTMAEGMLTPDEFFAAYDVDMPAGFTVMSFSDVTPDGRFVCGYGFNGYGAPIESFIIDLEAVTAVSAVPVAGGPRLGPAHPNPFNPSTTFDLSLERDGHVWVEIFDARGQHVRTLHNGTLAEGRHSLNWNGRDDAGGRVASGVYLARVRDVHGQGTTQRMSLVK